jgi:hypothetical protein
MGASSKYRAFIRKLNVSTGAFAGSPWLIDSKYTHGAAGIFNIVLENDGALVLGGWCIEDSAAQDEWWRAGKPWLVKYDLTSSQKIWEEVYDYAGYYIYSVYHNSIGSYLLEIYNEDAAQSFLISTDLMGKASEQNLAAIPRSSSFIAAAPGTPRISATLTPVADAELATEARRTVAKGQNCNITAAGTWQSYQWYVDGTLVSGQTSSTYIFTTTARAAGIYTVTLVVTDAAGGRRSASCRVTVTN